MDLHSPIPLVAARESRIPELDGLRGFAAVAVVAAHYFGEVQHGLPGLAIAWMGVNLFFVLSGFLIGSIILEKKDSPNFFAVFYVRRAFRILPVYFCTLAAVQTFIWLHCSNPWTGEPLQPLSYVTFTQNVVMAVENRYGSPWLLPTWTLAVEEQFYLVMPLLLVVTPQRLLLPAILSGIAACFAVRGILYLYRADIAGQVLLFSRGDILLCGVLAAYVHRTYKPREIILRLIPLGCIIAVIALSFRIRQFSGESPLFFTLSPLLVGVMSACYVLLAARRSDKLKVFRRPFWVFFGTISYCLYLIHQPIAGILHGLIFHSAPDIGSLPQIAATIAATFISITLAWLSWRLMEKPLLQLGRTWSFKETRSLSKVVTQIPMQEFRRPQGNSASLARARRPW